MDIPDSKTVSFSMEYRELLRTLDNDESVRTFMDGKLNERGEMAQVSNGVQMEFLSSWKFKP